MCIRVCEVSVVEKQRRRVTEDSRFLYKQRGGKSLRSRNPLVVHRT